MEVTDDAPALLAAACALALLDDVLENAIAIPELDRGAIPSSVRLNVSVGTVVCGSCAALLPDVVADAVQVKAKKIEMIIVASIVFFMLENLLFPQ